jgi:WD40 repeat protein
MYTSSGSLDTTIRVWSATDGAHLQTLTGHTDLVEALAFGPDGNLFSGSRDGTVQEWSRSNGSHLRTLQCDARGVDAIAVGLDGRLFVRGFCATVHMWQPMASASRSIGIPYPGSSGSPRPLCISAAGTLYTGWVVQDDEGREGDDGVIYIW